MKNILSIREKEVYTSKVSSNTDPVRLASSIQLSLMSDKHVELLAMGKDSVYSMMKAICITQGFAGQNGLKLRWQPGFKIVTGEHDGKKRTVLSWLIESF